MTSPPPSTHERRLDLEGLRGLAVLLVVCFHAGVPWLRGAFVAVDVFFVLSGYFLAAALARHLIAGDGFSLRDVYARRLWRLLPAMAVVVLATLAMAMLLYAPIDRAAVADNTTAVSLFVSNLAFAGSGVNYFSAGENPLLHTWTLGVEFQIALLLPAIVLALVAFANRRAASETGHVRRMVVLRTALIGITAIGALSFVVSLSVSRTTPMWAYFGPHTRLWAFCAGAAMAFIAGGGQSVLGISARRNSVAQMLGLAAILVPALLYDRSMPYPGALALAPVGGTLLLLATGDIAAQTPVGRALACSPLARIGSVSYPWYLWHWPLMVLGTTLMPGIGVGGHLAFGLVGLVFAVLTHRFVEKPVNARVMPRMLAGSPLLYAGALTLTLVLIAQIAAARSTRFVANSVHRTFAAARNDRKDHGCWASSISAARTARASDCAFGDARSHTTLALLGDSHAEHWLGGLERAGEEHGWRIDARVMGGCPVSDFSALTSGALSRRYSVCSRYRESMIAEIIAQKPNAVILSSFDSYIQTDDGAGADYQVAEAAWTEGLRRTYARFDGAGIPVIVIRGTPRVPFDVPACLSRRAARLPFATDCTYAIDAPFVARARHAQDVAARGLHVHFVDMNDQVCSTSRCPTMRDGIVMFTDDNHLTASFAQSAGLVLGQRIDEALRR